MTNPDPATALMPIDHVVMIEYLPDGCALATRVSGAEQLMMPMDVPEFLLSEDRKRREISYGG